MTSMAYALDKREMRRSFDRAAAQYDGAARLQREIGSILLDRLGNDDYWSKWILDAGSGTGFCTRRLAQTHTNVVACDIAPSMLKAARLRHAGAVHYVCGDIESLPLEASSFDLVLSNLALQWCDDLDSAFANFARILKPTGFLLFSTFGPKTLCELRAAWKQADGGERVNRFCGSRRVADAVAAAGLTDIRVEREIMTRSYADVYQLMAELKQLGARNVIAGRPRALTGKNRLEKMVDAYGRMMPGGRIIATFEVMVGFAKGGSEA